MAAELTSRARPLEASDNARRQLLADVSHELMTPLTAMRGYIETLGMPELRLDSPTRERYLQITSPPVERNTAEVDMTAALDPVSGQYGRARVRDRQRGQSL